MRAGDVERGGAVAWRPRSLAVGRRWGLRQGEAAFAALAISPLVAVLGLLIAYPIGQAVYLSLTQKMIGLPPRFVGLRNYQSLASDPFFWMALKNTAVFTVASIALKLTVGLAMASTLNASIPGRNFFRGLLLIPWITPTVVIALTYLWIFDGTFGILNEGLSALGLPRVPWLSHPATAMASVIWANFWRGFPFFGISFLAAMQSIPRELYEAAVIDGANPFQQWWSITLPSLRHAITVVTLLSTIWTFNEFNLIYILTRGGPAGATQVVGTLTYQYAIEGLRLGKGIAVSLVSMPLFLLAVWAIARQLGRD